MGNVKFRLTNGGSADGNVTGANNKKLQLQSGIYPRLTMDGAKIKDGDNGGDLKFTFADSEDSNSEIIPELQEKVKNYQETVIAIGGIHTSVYDTAPDEPVTEDITGDLNGDGSFNVADIVTLQNYLLGRKKTLSDWQAADLSKNGRLDVFGLVMMRRRLFTE